MPHNVIRLVSLLALVVAGSGMAVFPVAAQGTPVDVASPAATPSVEIADIREIELGFEPIALSPDGAWIAGVEDRSTICLLSLADDTSRCRAVTLNGSILSQSIAWAPDSSAIAFSLDAIPTLRNSDIFVLDVENADLVDLTPDPETNGRGEGTPTPAIRGSHVAQPGGSTPASGETAFWMDIFPAWSPDGTELVFARHSVPDGSTRIMRMPRAGGEASAVVNVPADKLSIVVGPILWPLDDVIVLSGAGSKSGIWEASLETGALRLILASDNSDLPNAVAVSISADGEWLSVYSTINLQMFDFDGFFGLVERETGELLIFTFAEGLDRYVNVVPRFGPEGPYVVATQTGNPQTLMIWDITTGRPVVSFSLPGDGPDIDLLLIGLTWAANGMILVPGPDESAYIVQIETAP